MNESAKMLRERMACGMLDELEIFELPDDLAYVFQDGQVEIGTPHVTITISKESILKIADRIKEEKNGCEK